MSDNNPVQINLSNNWLDLLTQLKITVLISTYQAGTVIALRAQNNQIYSHFRNFKKAMGIAGDRQKLAIGTAYHIKEFYNMPVFAKRIEGGNHDACYLLRNTHVTGEIDIHEMAWAGDQLWFINTLFSCLCTLDESNSFVPRWRPPFISGYAPEDRCHLNGLAIVNNKPKYVTALGTADTPQGWRQHKSDGGMLMDIENNEFILRGLSMPHSPRLYRDKLWVLESGRGALGYIDPRTGKLETVIRVPGFTRGLDFYGNLAFIGLSQLRARSDLEREVFRDLPLTDEYRQRTCGVWVVDIDTGNIVATLRFENGVEEIFAVQVLNGVTFPEIIDTEEESLEHHLGKCYALPNEMLGQAPTAIR